MFWQAQLKALEARRQRVISESDLARALIEVHGRDLGRSLSWVGTALGWVQAARPLAWLAAPAAGLLLGGRVRRIIRWAGVAGPVFRGLRVALARWRMPARGAAGGTAPRA